jgi:hypothetical protein
MNEVVEEVMWVVEEVMWVVEEVRQGWIWSCCGEEVGRSIEEVGGIEGLGGHGLRQRYEGGASEDECNCGWNHGPGSMSSGITNALKERLA